MKKVTFLTAIVVVLFFVPLNTFASVIINEIAWMGTDISSNDEWIELYNTSDEDVNLGGWALEAVDGTPSINLEGNIPANGYFLLERTDDTSVPNVTADQIYNGALGNSGEYLKLKDAGNSTLDEINASDGWLAGNNTTKQTMERITDGWQTSLNSGGTPKAKNSSGEIVEEELKEPEESEVPILPTGNNPPIADAGDNIIGFIGQEINFDGTKSTDPDEDELAYSWNMGDGKLIEQPIFTYKYPYPGTYLVTLMVYDGRNYASDTITVKIQSQQITINEFIPNPEGEDEKNEWIEIYNDSNSIVDISEWQLDDAEEGSKPFVFPQNTLIAPKSYLVFVRQITDIALNNDKDSVRLLLPERVVFQEVIYENPKEGQSSARTDEGFVWSQPTPGLPNLASFKLAEGIGGEVVYQQPIESEITKEPSKDYSWYYQDQLEQEIEGGYAILPLEEELEPSFAEATEGKKESQLATIGEFPKKKFFDKSTLNLTLMIVAVVLAGLVIGLSFTKFRKKFL